MRLRDRTTSWTTSTTREQVVRNTQSISLTLLGTGMRRRCNSLCLAVLSPWIRHWWRRLWRIELVSLPPAMLQDFMILRESLWDFLGSFYRTVTGSCKIKNPCKITIEANYVGRGALGNVTPLTLHLYQIFRFYVVDIDYLLNCRSSRERFGEWRCIEHTPGK